MSLFENGVVRGQCRDAVDAKHRKKFLSKWDSRILRRSDNWLIMREKERQSTYKPQLQFAACCCQYASFVANEIRNLKGEKCAHKKLNSKIPWLGPRFLPETYTSQKRRLVSPDVIPDLACLKPVTILHPYFFDELNICPRCGATGDDLSWGRWTTSGPRDVHGVYGEEQVIGVQMRCNKCKEARGNTGRRGGRGKGGGGDDDDDDDYDDPSYCWGTASYQFWEGKEHWEIPNGVPHMKWRSAVTSDLYDLIIELRPSLTSAGLAEHIKQLHLLQYHKQRREYLASFEARAKQKTWLAPAKLQKFPEPHTGRHQEGYDNTSISDELITDIYLNWSKATRQGESEESLRTKTALAPNPGVALSIDATFRSASKATVTDKDKTHTCVYKGGITTVLNEETVIVAWRFCFTQGNWELQELLQGIKRRLTLRGVPEPDMVVSDCCCHVAKAIHEVFPDAVVCLDVWHLLMQYLVCLVGGSKSPVRANVARDIVDAVLKSRALDKTPAVYWKKDEQEVHLEAAFKKWESKGVWTAAGTKAHQEQLGHVRKGCLTRPRDDIRADGSRIEGSHKGWNSLQRSFSSGIEMMAALGHDFVLRHNTRVEYALKAPPMFTRSTFGSHHIRLVNDCAQRWNKQLAKADKEGLALEPLPVLDAPNSGETFGMMKMSPDTAAHQSLTSIKKEPADEEHDLLDLSSQDFLDANYVLSGVGVDPSLLYQLPQPSSSATSPDVLPEYLRSSSITPHPCAFPHDTSGLGLTPQSLSSPPPRLPASERNGAMPPPACLVRLNILRAPRRPRDRQHPSATTRCPLPACLWPLPGQPQPLPEGVLPGTFSSQSWNAPLFAFSPESTPPSSGMFSTTAGQEDMVYDPDSREQKTAIMETADRKGKAVDRGAMPAPAKYIRRDEQKGLTRAGLSSYTARSMSPDTQVPSTRKCRAESDDNALQAANPIEISSGDESDGPSQQKPPRRKKLRLHVPGMPTATKTKPETTASEPKGSTSTSPDAGLPSSSLGATLESFFQSQSQSSTQLISAPSTTHFPRPTISGLTRSQRLFSVTSGGIDPRSLSLKSVDYPEFKLFLRLRTRDKWMTYTMSPYHWVCAASIYNKELEDLNKSTRTQRPLKTPRALMDKLFELEPKLIARIISGDYGSRSGHSPTFWYPHCHAFPLYIGGRSGSELAAKLVNGKKVSPKVHTCHRCKRVMYPGPANSKLNHARGICSDQVWQSARLEKARSERKVAPALEEPPPFPQPEKLFTADKGGHYFHADRLFRLLRDFYVRIILGVAGSGPNAMYDIAFAALLQARVKVLEASPTSSTVVLFRPYRNVKTMGLGDGQTYLNCGEEWIRLDDLSDNDNIEHPLGDPGSQPDARTRTPEPVATPEPGPLQVGRSRNGESFSPSSTSHAGSQHPDISRAGSQHPDKSHEGSP
ncbi:hypothetical protein GSI_01555 [Ganoderma sinense ZZ0214-1]|uniref:Uncharacterized protein n=1 Tax=Ganoderma sinense ZZ0214-1 TaxID=1077348 RepID=A0A2G8SQ47_9APHY|nr:hypothetical protein GSI_01555 [Ganoderma sinense ZZ0214-1]